MKTENWFAFKFKIIDFNFTKANKNPRGDLVKFLADSLAFLSDKLENWIKMAFIY